MKRKFVYLLVFLIFAGCSTEKNTSVTRFYHNLTAHYNVYFNGYQSFLEGVKKLEKEHKDRYDRILPVFKYSYPDAPQFVQAEMNRALEKAAKTISNHSITAKPKIKNRRQLSPRDKELLKKTEYCKWIDDAYLLIGKANFYKGEYTKSVLALRRILSQFKTENTRFEASLWLAKNYIAQKKYKDAENTLQDLEKDPRHPKKLDKEIALTFADLYIHTEKYDKAITYLLKGIDLTKRKREKARYYYIIAQLYALQNKDDLANKYFKKVIKSNPPYEMAFNAKINRAIAFTKNQNTEEIAKELKKLLRDEKNEEFKDQIYYALAMLYLKNGDTATAVKNFKLSTANSVSDNSQKALSFLALADIFFKQKKFLLAGQYYDSTMQYLSKDYPNYDKISKKAENTGLLVKYLSEVKLQDSLQRVAKMPENERNKLIQKLIQQAIEEQKRQQEQDNTQFFDPLDAMNPANNPQSQGGKWYFYNPVLVSRGQQEFKKKWGNRKLEDNWRRKNKAIVNAEDQTEENTEENKNLITDKTKPEYYLQNLPLTDSLMEISNQKIINALFNAGDVYQNLLKDKKAAIKIYEELLKRYPDNQYKLEVYYRLYQLNKSLKNSTEAEKYRKKIIVEFPDSKYAKLLLDPNYTSKLEAIRQKILADYEKTLSLYKQKAYNQVIKNADTALKKHPELDIAPYFLYLKAMSYGNLGYTDSLKSLLTLLVNKYKNSQIKTQAQAVLDVLNSGKYDISIYTYKPEEKHAFAALVNKDCNLTVLKFQLFSIANSYDATKSFEVKINDLGNGQKLLTVEWFDNLQEARKFTAENDLLKAFETANCDNHQEFFISEKNLNTLLKDKNLMKYQIFYDKFYK